LHPPAYTRAWSPFPYQTPLKEAIGLFKYQGKVSLAHPLADLLLAALGSLPPIDLILPVPLHPKRLREREYNQSLLLTNRLSQNLNIPLSYTNLIRIRNTPPQISLKRKDRLKNLRGSFQVYQPELIAKKNLLLIDDVLTTGTTVNECARTLRKAGSGHVYVATLARMV
jgi:ComF family protein